MRVDIYEYIDSGAPGFITVAIGHKPPKKVLPNPPRETEAPDGFECPCEDCEHARRVARERADLKARGERLRRTDPSHAVACETLEILKSIDITLKRIESSRQW